MNVAAKGQLWHLLPVLGPGPLALGLTSTSRQDSCLQLSEHRLSLWPYPVTVPTNRLRQMGMQGTTVRQICWGWHARQGHPRAERPQWSLHFCILKGRKEARCGSAHL